MLQLIRKPIYHPLCACLSCKNDLPFISTMEFMVKVWLKTCSSSSSWQFDTYQPLSVKTLTQFRQLLT